MIVLTHHGRDPIQMEGGTTFHFVTEGFDAAYAAACEVAGDEGVDIAGGASTVEQALVAGVIDELTLDIAPFCSVRVSASSTGLNRSASKLSRCSLTADHPHPLRRWLTLCRPGKRTHMPPSVWQRCARTAAAVAKTPPSALMARPVRRREFACPMSSHTEGRRPRLRRPAACAGRQPEC